MLRRNWVESPDVPANAIARLVEALGVSLAVARVLAARGYVDPDAAARFLRPDLAQLASPSKFLGAPEAIDLLLACIRDRRRILVFGDFDVDGVTGTSLAVGTLRALGGDVDYLLPHRLQHGYGLSKRVLPCVIERQPAVVFTVDCGIKSVEEVAELRRMGIHTIVTDHHEPGHELPPAAAVVDPKRPGCGYPDKNLAGVGVVWQLLRGVVERLEHEFDFGQQLDLVAFGTVADVVPLVGENRALVHEGLAVIERRRRIGMMALVDTCRIEEPTDAWHLAYLLGPRVNAAGRLGDAGEAVRLFLSTETAEAQQLARRLDDENLKRQEISEQTLRQALAAIERGTAGDQPDGIVLASNVWHPGVIGIASARLVERFHRPTALIAMDGDVGRGSVRSIRGVDACQVLDECAELLLQYGGHAMAAGFSIRRENVAPFRARFRESVSARLTEDNRIPRLRIDGRIAPGDVCLELAEDLARLGPFGYGNARPVFLIPSATPACRPRNVGRGHLKVTLRCEGKEPLECIGFDLGDRADREFPDGPVDLAGSISINRWNERTTAQFLVSDFRGARS